MKFLKTTIGQIGVLTFILLGLPVLGIALSGKPISDYLEFPPRTVHVEHAGFSWAAFVLIALFSIVTTAPFIVQLFRNANFRIPQSAIRNPQSLLPWWGIAAAILGIFFWIVAWNRFPWFSAFQSHTFTPLWLCYIVFVNALTFKRTGHCILRDRPAYLGILFIASAFFWWFFEYLNRFSQNWYYVGIDTFSAWDYFWFATLAFSTVLPAVLSTKEFLRSFKIFDRAFQNFYPLPKINLSQKIIPILVLILSSIGLALIGIFPDYLFPLLWISPLLILTSFKVLQGENHIFTSTRWGDWRDIVTSALAALICGFFWEMWNNWSLAKWIYLVPFVSRFHIFEMPLLGFSGYLPFGLECLAIAKIFELTKGNLMNASKDRSNHNWNLARLMRFTNGLIVIGFSFVVFILPCLTLFYHFSDPALHDSKGIPKIAWQMHRSLTPRYETWTRERIASGLAATVNTYDVPATEWAMFGSVFYLGATANLQKEWDNEKVHTRPSPVSYSKEAIEGATDLLMDPKHHTWVKTHWGEDYLHTENVFFRAMLIQGLTCREELLRDGKHLEFLRDQVETLAKDLDQSPHGVLNDYPGECYPIDVFGAITMIRRADKVLGTDHQAFVKRALRGFQGKLLDECGLPPYVMSPETGFHLECSRGIGNSYVCMYAPELYPQEAVTWYDSYTKHFWQQAIGGAGFREYPHGIPNKEWTFDVDAGPIFAGYSSSGNAYAMAAARVNGRYDHAWTLSTQVLSASLPLPNGTLITPKFLSDPVHAPYLGEVNLLYLFTHTPAQGTSIKTGGSVPPIIYGGFIVFLAAGTLVIYLTIRNMKKWSQEKYFHVQHEKEQFIAWLALLIAAIVAPFFTVLHVGLICLFLLQFFPRFQIK